MGAYSRKIHVCNTHIQWYVLFQWGFHSPLLKGALGFLELVSNGVESLAVLRFTFIVEFHHGFQTTCALTAHRMVGMRKTPDRPLPVTVPMWRFGRSVGSAMRRFWLESSLWALPGISLSLGFLLCAMGLTWQDWGEEYMAECMQQAGARPGPPFLREPDSVCLQDPLGQSSFKGRSS